MAFSIAVNGMESRAILQIRAFSTYEPFPSIATWRQIVRFPGSDAVLSRFYRAINICHVRARCAKPLLFQRQLSIGPNGPT